MPSAARPAAIATRLAAAVVIAAALAGLVPLVTFAVQKGGRIGLDAYVWRILGFTLWQAGLSTVISIMLALPAALALAGTRFRGRAVLMSLLAVPQSLPAIVVVLLLVDLFGARGILAGTISLYGLAGIVMAHVYFNLPLALRLFVQVLEAVAPENRRLAAQLGFAPRALWRHVDWPALRPAVARIAALIFLLCAASFVVVLTLGGPAATTLEVAIYQSLRIDFDVARALSLSLLQVALCAVLVVASGNTAWIEATASRRRASVSEQRPVGKAAIATIIATAIVIGLPLLMLVVDGLPNISLTAGLFQALATSAAMALASTLLALAMATALARGGSFANSIGLLGLIVPPAVLATGWFVLLRRAEGGIALSASLVVALNALMALPFAMALLVPAFATMARQQDRLATHLNVMGWNKFRLIDLPILRKPLAQAGLLAFALSLGDLTAVTLLGSQGLVTLPSLLHLQMGNYRSGNAIGTALVLALLCVGLGSLANSRRLLR